LTVDELEERLSRPTQGVIDTVSRLTGDYMVLGAAGKMGPTLCRMLRRALDAAESSATVTAVARFSDPDSESTLQSYGVRTIRCDLLDRNSVFALPDAANVIYMAGQKFGTTGNPGLTWAMNTLAPAYCADRFAGSRTVVFSTGCVYPNTPIERGGSREEDALEPVGEYGNSCVGRERVYEYFAQKHGSRTLLFRLNYAVDLRYGVLVDIARKVWAGAPLDVTMGYANVIWQGDANAMAIRCLEIASNPPVALNVTGIELLSVREVARQLGQAFGKEPVVTGQEAPMALLSNARKMVELMGEPEVSTETLIAWVAEWMKSGGNLLNKPTHFEVSDGRY
jgi:nucleoside-diphosphate-sugar epimerase